MKNVVIKTSVITVAIILLLLSFSYSVLSLFFPSTVARMASDLNLDALALHYYEKNYQNTNDINDLYHLINTAQSSKNYEMVVKYYEILEDDSQYYDFIDFINEQNYNSQLNKILLSTLINEDNYMKNIYTTALVKLGQFSDAMSYSILNFDYENYNIENLGVYTFSNILTVDGLSNQSIVDLLQTNYKSTNANIADAIYEYYNNSFVVFENNKNTLDYDLQVKLIALASRMNIMASNLNEIVESNNVTTNIDMTLVNARLETVNIGVRNLI